MEAGRNLLSDALAEALDGHRCASGWLGYANVLFLGFGDACISPHTGDGPPTEPPYEVNANKADWQIDGDGLSACADDDRCRGRTGRGRPNRLCGSELVRGCRAHPNCQVRPRANPPGCPVDGPGRGQVGRLVGFLARTAGRSVVRRLRRVGGPRMSGRPMVRQSRRDRAGRLKSPHKRLEPSRKLLPKFEVI